MAQALHEAKQEVPYLHAHHGVIFFYSINFPGHLLIIFTVWGFIIVGICTDNQTLCVETPFFVVPSLALTLFQ